MGEKPDISLARRIVRGGLTSVGVRMSGLALGFFAQVLLSRSLGVSAFGAYSVALSWCLFLTVVVKFGMDTTVLKFAAGYRGEGQHHGTNALAVFAVRMILRMLLIVGGGLAVIAFIKPDLFGLSSWTETGWMIVLIGALSILGVFQSFFRAAERIFFSQVFEQVLRSVFMIALTVGAVWLGWRFTSNTGLGIAALAAVLAVLSLFIAFRAFIWTPGAGHAMAEEHPEWMSVSWPLFWASATTQFVTQMTTIVLGVLATTADAGQYAAAFRLAAFVNFGLGALNSITAPMVAAAYRTGDAERLNSIASINARVATLVSAAPVLVLTIWGHEILGLFGHEFSQAYPALVILLVGGMFGAAVGPVGFFLTMTDQQSAFLKISVGTLVLTFLLTVALVPAYGLIGGAVAATFGKILQNAVCWYAVWRRRGIDTSFLGLHKSRPAAGA